MMMTRRWLSHVDGDKMEPPPTDGDDNNLDGNYICVTSVSGPVMASKI